MSRYKVEYSFTKLNKNGVSDARYNLYDNEACKWLVNTTYVTYKPQAQVLEESPIDTMNDLKERVRQAIRARIRATLGIYKDIEFTCTNPDSDFLTRSEMFAINKAKRRERADKVGEGISSNPTEANAVTGAEKRLYEVIKKNDVWTIVKHETELLTAQEAKTQLFAHIVNGD